MEWLEDESVSSGSKCAELQAEDEHGWCPLHYAARYYSSDILAAALDVEEGMSIHTPVVLSLYTVSVYTI